MLAWATADYFKGVRPNDFSPSRKTLSQQWTLIHMIGTSLMIWTQVTTTDFMTATRCNFDDENKGFLDHVSSRITNEVEGITRVLFDSKPLHNVAFRSRG